MLTAIIALSISLVVVLMSIIFGGMGCYALIQENARLTATNIQLTTQLEMADNQDQE